MKNETHLTLVSNKAGAQRPAKSAARADERERTRRLSLGDEDAWREFTAEHQRPLHGFIGKFLRNPADVDEIVQEVFLKAFLDIRGFDGRSRLQTWLFSVAFHTAIDRVRRQEPRPAGPVVADREVSMRTAFEILADGRARTELRHKIAGLPAKQRAVIVLKYYVGLTDEEIASIVDVATSRVRGIRQEAMRSLREGLPNELL